MSWIRDAKLRLAVWLSRTSSYDGSVAYVNPAITNFNELPRWTVPVMVIVVEWKDNIPKPVDSIYQIIAMPRKRAA